jgi:hypothetical protein
VPRVGRGRLLETILRRRGLKGCSFSRPSNSAPLPRWPEVQPRPRPPPRPPSAPPSLPRNLAGQRDQFVQVRLTAVAVTVERSGRSLRPAAGGQPGHPGVSRSRYEPRMTKSLPRFFARGERIRCQCRFQAARDRSLPGHVFSGMVSGFSPAAVSLVSISESAVESQSVSGRPERS